MKLTKTDYDLFRDLAMKHMVNRATPVDQNGKILHDRDFTSHCLLEAALSIFKKAGVVSNEVNIDLNPENECRSSL